MTEESDKAEAWLEKPRKIIHNQKLILTLLSLTMPATLIMVTLVLWATTIFPETILLILIAWLITTISYITLIILRKIVKRRQKS